MEQSSHQGAYRNSGDTMTAEEARQNLAMHAGRTEHFSHGYCYALRFGFRHLEEIQSKFDDIFFSLQILNNASYFVHPDSDLLVDLSEILYGSILYVNRQMKYERAIRVFAEVLSETFLSLFGQEPHPFVAFEHYRENYDDQLQETSFEQHQTQGNSLCRSDG
ncbi:MAG TPA: hypothetical protein H9841_07550 [Candidatus Flavonifractor merdigallinarum]|uniref:Uncharacterized protein n=1 Tax=Candidatus Flavonifractor merdigallinarum TaxID=2838589 RepID=A0A9D2BXZ9_9FIRM|nr:hypothetical protein [Candidatus Flavonifractor merdigallinarum]